MIKNCHLYNTRKTPGIAPKIAGKKRKRKNIDEIINNKVRNLIYLAAYRHLTEAFYINLDRNIVIIIMDKIIK